MQIRTGGNAARRQYRHRASGDDLFVVDVDGPIGKLRGATGSRQTELVDQLCPVTRHRAELITGSPSPTVSSASTGRMDSRRRYPKLRPAYPSAKPVWKMTGTKVVFDESYKAPLPGSRYPKSIRSLFVDGYIEMRDYTIQLPPRIAPAQRAPATLLDDIRTAEHQRSIGLDFRSTRSEVGTIEPLALSHGLQVGGRNVDMHKLACSWWRRYWRTPDVIWDLARRVWNNTSHDNGFDWNEAAHCVVRAGEFIERNRADERARYEQQRAMWEPFVESLRRSGE